MVYCTALIHPQSFNATVTYLGGRPLPEPGKYSTIRRLDDNAPTHNNVSVPIDRISTSIPSSLPNNTTLFGRIDSCSTIHRRWHQWGRMDCPHFRLRPRDHRLLHAVLRQQFSPRIQLVEIIGCSSQHISYRGAIVEEPVELTPLEFMVNAPGHRWQVSPRCTDWFGPPDCTGDIIPFGSGDPIITTNHPPVVSIIPEFLPVPAPATVWLFGSGLIGLIGAGRREHQNRTFA